MGSGADLHRQRDRAESFGAVAQLYDRARPSYPAALIDALLGSDVPTDKPMRVLDVGCGTGIAAALLKARGCEVLGVEVDRRMAVIAKSKGLAVEVCAFEHWDAAGRNFDLITAAQSWHWIDPHLGVHKAAGALAPEGRLAVFWNLGDLPEQVRALLGPIYARLEPEVENYSVLLGHGQDRTEQALAAIQASKRFERHSVQRFAWRYSYDTERWLEHLCSHSDHQTLPRKRRERLLAAIAEALDGIGGHFEMGYEAVLCSAARSS